MYETTKEKKGQVLLSLAHQKINVEELLETIEINKVNIVSLRFNDIPEDDRQKIITFLEENKTICSFRFTQMSNKETTILSKALKTNFCLTELNLSMGKIGDKGATKLAEGVKGNTTLTTLDLNTNKIGSKGAIELAKALTENHVTDFNLANNEIKYYKNLKKAFTNLVENKHFDYLILDNNGFNKSFLNKIYKIVSEHSLTISAQSNTSETFNERLPNDTEMTTELSGTYDDTSINFDL